ncbi:MAG: ACT domain-containing protein [Desulfobacteraceae bacterium]|nr:ACT domain-containing protein [Desulfobacteraceae bacterium]
MQAEQISIFIENKAGRISDVTGILADAGVNIRALAVADTSDFGVLRLIVDNNVKAEEALKKAGFTVRKTKVVAVKVEDRPGGLHSILTTLKQAGINVEYMYAFIQQTGDKAIMIFRFDQPEEAIRVLTEKGVTVVDERTLSTL